MKEAAPTLLPLLRTRTQGEILTWVLLHPEEAYTLVEIADAVGTSAPTVMREVQRLEEAGLVSSTRRGNTRLVRARTDNVVYRPLADLMAVTFGPLAVLREVFTEVPGIEHAFIYGSWAARYHGGAGAVPADVDVLVIGHPDRDRLDDAVDAAEARLRREVNVRVVTPQSWAADESGFKATVTSRPTVTVIGDDEDE